jgi:POT family proton-dependent oligopeptide transporter
VPATIERPSLERPAVFQDRSLLGHPKGLGLLFAVEMWERFSFYGMRALLVLYLVNCVQWTDARAANLYGTYLSLVWLAPIVGGYLADRFIGTRRSLVIGGVVIAMGHFVLAFQSMTTFYLGLALVIIGTGFFKPNVSTMVGQIYGRGDTRRDAGFTVFYMGINTGAFIAPLICGWLGQRVGWHWGFGAAGVGMLLGLLVYLWGRDRYLPGIGVGVAAREHAASAPDSGPATNPVHVGIGAVAGFAIAWFSGGGWVSLIMGTLIGAALAVSILGSHGDERRRVVALFIVAFFVVFFWMAYDQAGSSMNIFADRYTDLQVGSFAIPSSWFQSFDAGFILVFAIPFATLWRVLGERNREPSTALKMVIGLFVLGLGFLFMVFGARSIDACVAQVGAAQSASACHIAAPWWLISAYACHTIGELCLSPVGLSYVTKVAPARFASLLMGVWFLANAAADKVGGVLAASAGHFRTQSAFWLMFVVTSIGASLLMLLVVPLLKRLTASVAA